MPYDRHDRCAERLAVRKHAGISSGHHNTQDLARRDRLGRQMDAGVVNKGNSQTCDKALGVLTAFTRYSRYARHGAT